MPITTSDMHVLSDRIFRLLASAVCLLVSVAAEAQDVWQRPPLAESNQVQMGGVWGDVYVRGLARLGRDPFTTPLVLADVNFGMKRWFTNFSGDISGRFLEIASLSSASDSPRPAILREVIDQIAQYQKADGHFGVEVNWQNPIDLTQDVNAAKMMPIMWGNGRLLLGLLAAHERFGDKKMLDAAKKLGDFYVNVAVDRFCDPKRVDEYRKPAAYAGNYVTCTYEGMEGLVKLYRATHDKRYLEAARRMADFHEAFDTLPVDHTHGSLSQHCGLILLYEETGDKKYLDRVTKRWEAAVAGGYVNPCGGVLEKFWVTGYDRDEGCAEADWLRLNLWLWRNTGATRYLDMAERLLWGAYLANQWPSGGFGHRHLGVDDQGAYAFRLPSEESLWCCSFHGPLGLYDLKSFLAAADGNNAIRYNFPVDFKTPLMVGRAAWTVTSKSLPGEDAAVVHTQVVLQGPEGGKIAMMVRKPEWADRVVVAVNGKELPLRPLDGYLRSEPVAAGTTLEIAYLGGLKLETRRCARVEVGTQLPITLEKVVVRRGPFVLFNATSGDIQAITLRCDPRGGLHQSYDVAEKLVPWPQLAKPTEPHAFLFNVRVEAAE